MRWIAALTVALFLAAVRQVLAVKLEPGEYQLQWMTQTQSPFSTRSMMFEPLTERSPDIKGAASEDVVWGRSEHLTVVIDASGGTGSEFDRAYLVQEHVESVDLAAAVRIDLKEEGDELSGTGTITVATGPPGARFDREASVGVTVYCQEKKPYFGLVRIGAGWKGSVATDSGKLPVELYDFNDNGIYGDRMSVPEADSPDDIEAPGDIMLLGDCPNTEDPASFANMIYLSEVTGYGGALYVFDITNGGQTLTISPYTGPTTRLQIKCVDGFGKSVGWDMSMIAGYSGLYAIRNTKSDIVLPPTKITMVQVELAPEPAKPRDKQMMLRLQPSSLPKLGEGKTSVLKLGGPMTVEINREVGVVTARQGENLRVDLSFEAGDCKLAGLTGRAGANVNIRDARGRLLKSGIATFG